MKLNQNSKTARLYRWFYITDNMPTNLCPYFWKLAIMWLFIIPYSIFALPYLWMRVSGTYRENIRDRILGGLIVYGIIYLVFLFGFGFTVFFTRFPKDSFLDANQFMGVLVVMITLFVLTTGGLNWFCSKFFKKKNVYDEEGNLINESKPNIIIEFIKAKYNNYCPKIDWK